jgi:multimeric flavodoxin WrbA
LEYFEIEEIMTEPKILVISGSARHQGDTERYLNQVFAGTTYRHISLIDHTVYTYDYAETYPADDGFLAIAQQLLAYPAIVFATPVYWYSMSGRMKVFFDRMTELMHVHKAIGKQLKGKHLFLLAVSASEAMPAGFEVPFSETAGYFDMHYGGCIHFNSEEPNADRHQDIQAFIQSIQQVV